MPTALLRLYVTSMCVYGLLFFSGSAYAQDNPLRSTVAPLPKNKAWNIGTIRRPEPFSNPFGIATVPPSQQSGGLWPLANNPFKAALTTETSESRQLAGIIAKADKKNPIIKGAITVGKTVIFVIVVYDVVDNAVTVYYSDKNTVDITKALSRAIINLPGTVYATGQMGRIAPSFMMTPLQKSLQKISLQAARVAEKNVAAAFFTQGAKSVGGTSIKTLSSDAFMLLTSPIAFFQRCVDFANNAHAMEERLDILKPLKCNLIDLENKKGELMDKWRLLNKKKSQDMTNDEYEKIIQLEGDIQNLNMIRQKCLNITDEIADLEGSITEIRVWIKNNPLFCPSGII